jgi:hypothetical protein
MKFEIPGRRRAWLGILGLVLLFAALRWNNFNAPLIRDEGEYAYSARLLQAGLLPYQDAFLQKPPMVVYSYLFSYCLLPDVFWAPRLLAALFAAAATVLLGWMARLEFGKGPAWTAVWLMTPMILLPSLDQFIANTEMFMLLPMLATVAVYIHSRHHGGSGRHWLAAGFLGGLTLCYKYTSLPVLLVVFAAWSLEQGRLAGTDKRVTLWRCWAWGALGGLGAMALALGCFLPRDGGRALWECTVAFNRAYAGTQLFGMGAWKFTLSLFWSKWWLLFLLPLGALPRPKPRTWFWLAMLAGASAATGASVYWQYYITVMPFWALLAAVGAGGWAECLACWFHCPSPLIRRALIGGALALLLLCDAGWMPRSPKNFAETRFADSPFVEARAVAGRLAELSSPDDAVFVAGSEPEILFYAGRYSPNRFIIAYPFTVAGPALARRYQSEAIRALQDHPPAWIVCANPPESWTRTPETPLDIFDFLDRILNRDYVCVGGWLPPGPEGRWKEPLPASEFSRCSLVLFKRKARF